MEVPTYTCLIIAKAPMRLGEINLAIFLRVNLGRLMTKARKVPSLGSPYGQLMKNPLINGKHWWKLASLIQIY